MKAGGNQAETVSGAVKSVVRSGDCKWEFLTRGGTGAVRCS